MPPTHVYRPDERPDIEALVDGQWRPGEVRAWTQGADEARTFDVQYQPADTNSRTIATFTTEQLREDTVDRSRRGPAMARDDGASPQSETVTVNNLDLR